MLAFDNADLQGLLVPERPNLVGNPYAGVCPNGAKVGALSCWFNPGAFAGSWMRDAKDESRVTAGAGKYGCAPPPATTEEFKHSGQQLAHGPTLRPL